MLEITPLKAFLQLSHKHMNVPNEDIPIRVDDTHNVNVKHKDVEANKECDPNCCVKNDLDENEIKRSDEDIRYLLMRMMMMGRSQISMILECGPVTLHLITLMK